MNDPRRPGFDKRLRAALDRSRPPTPQAERARYSQPATGYRPLGRMKPALAITGALAVLLLAASAVAGSPDASAWTQRAVTTVESVAHVAQQPSPAPAPARSPQPKPKPAPAPAAPKAAAPGGASPEPSHDSHGQPSSTPSPETSPTPSDEHHESPSPSPGDGHGGSGHSRNPES